MNACLRLATLLGIGALTLACEDSTGSGASPDSGPSLDAGGPDASQNQDSGNPDGGVTCPQPTAGPTEHAGTITGAETWTADKSPHVVPADLAVSGTLTIEPCAEVVIGDVKSIDVGATGKLIAEGLATKPIRIHASDKAKPFAQLRASNGGTMRFAYVEIEDGGAPQNTIIDVIGTIHAQGADQTLPSQQTVFVDHVTVKGSRSNGVFLADGAGFAAGSNELTITGSANFAMSISPRAIATVPVGKYTGNAIDEIVLPGGGGANAVQEDATMHDRGVPYRIGNSLTQGILLVERTTGTSTLTIEPGVTMRFKKGGEFIVETFAGTEAARGALIAVGTEAKPIVFTSAEATPKAGDWAGVSFNMTPAATDKMDHTRVEYAGGLTSSGSGTCNTTPVIPDAAIRVRGLPAGQFVTNTVIMNSAAHGIDRGWQSDTKIDFTPTNQFLAVAACLQTFPKNTNGSCPDPVPCPML